MIFEANSCSASTGQVEKLKKLMTTRTTTTDTTGKSPSHTHSLSVTKKVHNDISCKKHFSSYEFSTKKELHANLQKMIVGTVDDRLKGSVLEK